MAECFIGGANKLLNPVTLNVNTRSSSPQMVTTCQKNGSPDKKSGSIRLRLFGMDKKSFARIQLGGEKLDDVDVSDQSQRVSISLGPAGIKFDFECADINRDRGRGTRLQQQHSPTRF